MQDLPAIRTEYARAGLDERDVDPSPIAQLDKWLREAIAAQHPEPTAMTLATASADGEPAARIVLLKGLDERGLVFFTGYESDKGRQLAENPRACACFFWVMLERQVRVTGGVARVSREETDAYFRGRPRESQLGAWASAQSSVLAGRSELEDRLLEVRARFESVRDVPSPPHWGGYRLVPEKLEVWQGRPSRLHDRLRYTRISPANAEPTWRIDRLAP
jgi:pyridoxamine 5'-phosphate oxidase